jgi:hypothetical protein
MQLKIITMSDLKGFLLAWTLIITVNVHAQHRKVVFIIADGIPTDIIEQSDIPALRKMAGPSGYARAHVGGDKDTYSQTPTISAVGYNSLLTGTWVNKHNVWDNDIKEPNYHYPTIFWYLKQARPAATIGVFSTWTLNRTLLVGDSLKQTGFLKVDFSADGYELDSLHFPHDKQDLYIHKIDELVAEKAAFNIEHNAPDLSWVYLQHTDDIGHQYGTGPEMKKAVAMLDNQLSKIFQAVQVRQKNPGEEWMILVTTDHGRAGTTGKNHGGQSDRERTTWIFTNAKNLNGYFYHNQPGIVDILPSIASFLQIQIPRKYLFELDGVPFNSDLSVVNPAATLNKDVISLTWTAIEKSGMLRIWLATSNNCQTGGDDNYMLMGEVASEKGNYQFSVEDLPSSFYKVVLEGSHNSVNKWIVIK